jgi:hypothetical protein
VPTTAVPQVLTDPGYLFVAPLASTMPNMGESAATAGKFTDAWPAAWVPLGATTEGSTFAYSTSVEAINAAEFFDPIKYVTTERSGNIAFALMDFTLKNYKVALNGGVGALVPAIGTGATAVYNYEPVAPGSEVRVMVGWESTDGTMRLVLRQTIQGGEVSVDFKKAPSVAAIPCTFNMEIPVGAAAPFKWASTRG